MEEAELINKLDHKGKNKEKHVEYLSGNLLITNLAWLLLVPLWHLFFLLLLSS